jgi:hypothetical protein
MHARYPFRFPRSRLVPSGLLVALLYLLSTPAIAAEDAEEASPPWRIAAWQVQTSVYTKHFDPDPDHNNDQNLIAVEALFENDWLAGAAVFDNSFGQPSQLLFVGKTWPLLGSQHWYVKLLGGLLHGYKEPYEDKIPLNGLGVAPAIIPALGFRYRRVLVEANLGGLAVVTFNVGVRF